MGIFRQFPYTNFHELNLDWILNELRGIDEKLDEALDTIKEKIADLVDDPAIREKIDEIIEEYLTPEQINEILAMVIERLTPLAQPNPEYINISNGKGRLINDNTNRVPQGSCCDGTYYYVYRNNYLGGAGVIDKYNMNGELYPRTEYNVGEYPVEHGTEDWTYVDSKAINLGHGNGMFYKEDEHKIYVSAYSHGADDSQTPDASVYVVDPDTLTVVETINAQYPLLGIGYNYKLEQWVGYNILYGNNDINNLIIYDKDWNIIKIENVPINSQFRAGCFVNDDYIYLLSTRGDGRGFANSTNVGGKAIESKLTIYDWNFNYRGQVNFHNGIELQSIAYTGKCHVATFYFNQSWSPYVSFIQLDPRSPFSYSWYRSNWGKNQLCWKATADANMYGAIGYITGIDTKMPYSGTHLEIEFSQDMTSAGQWFTIPRAFDQEKMYQWITITLVRSADIIYQSMRIDQTKNGIQIGACRTKTISNAGVVENLGEEFYYKVREVRSVNYTMQPRYNSYLELE